MLNADLQELYRLLADVLDGYNRTHDAQVVYLDFAAVSDGADCAGSLVMRQYDQSIIDYHYRDLRDDDFDWFGPEDWELPDRAKELERILAERRKTAQRYHRSGTSSAGTMTPWAICTTQGATIGGVMRRDRTVPVILPDQDSDDVQAAYAAVARMVEEFNAGHDAQIVVADFVLVGGMYGGRQRDYKGCYVNRDRTVL